MFAALIEKVPAPVKKIIVLGLNLVFAALLGLAEIYGWETSEIFAVALVVAIVVDTWLGIEWIPPKKPSNATRGSG